MMNQEFAAWLKSGNNHLFSIKFENYTYLFLRIPKRSGLDYLYVQQEWGGNGALRAKAFEFAAIYNTADGLFYCVENYCMNKLDHTNDDRSKDSLRKQLEQDVREMVEGRVNNDRNNLDVLELSDVGLSERLENYQKYYASRHARAAYLAGESPETYRFECEYSSELGTEDALLDYIVDPMGYAEREAERFWTDRNNQEKMLLGFLERDALAAEYEKLIADAENPVHTIRRIMEAVTLSGAKTVTVTIRKDGQDFTFKTETSSLRRDCTDTYGTWRIAAADRREFEKRFGRYAEYTPKEIICITYGRKTLYENNAE